jgi:hypothetical protein
MTLQERLRAAAFALEPDGNIDQRAVLDAAAIIERLPVTADGVTLIPTRDACYSLAGEMLEPHLPNDVRDSRVGQWIAMDYWAVEVGGLSSGYPLVSECFSTREAAEKARGG